MTVSADRPIAMFDSGFGGLTESNPVGPGMGPGSGVEFSYPALLTDDQIDAIVAFERTL